MYKKNIFSLSLPLFEIINHYVKLLLQGRRTKKNRDPSYSSYLIDIDKLCKNVTWQSYTRLDEFIND